MLLLIFLTVTVEREQLIKVLVRQLLLFLLNQLRRTQLLRHSNLRSSAARNALGTKVERRLHRDGAFHGELIAIGALRLSIVADEASWAIMRLAKPMAISLGLCGLSCRLKLIEIDNAVSCTAHAPVNLGLSQSHECTLILTRHS